MRRFNIFLIIFLGLVCNFRTAHGTTVLLRSVDDLSKSAPVVVHGRVVRLEVNNHTGRRTAIVKSLEVARGRSEFLAQRDFYVPLLNRAFPHRDLVEMVAAAPELKLHEEVVLFLRPLSRENEGIEARTDRRPVFGFEGFHQGKLKVLKDKKGIKRVATWSEWPDRPLTPQELQAQRSTARLEGDEGTPIPVELRAKVQDFRTLESVLAISRASKVSE